MFSEMVTAIRDNRKVDLKSLRLRFDFALTKKMGILQLPKTFWMKDPKINPRASHLFWAALLLRDHERISLAVSVIEEELAAFDLDGPVDRKGIIARRTRELVRELLDQLSDGSARQKLEDDLQLINPTWFR